MLWRVLKNPRCSPKRQSVETEFGQSGELENNEHQQNANDCDAIREVLRNALVRFQSASRCS